jgi:hypothetical protein
MRARISIALALVSAALLGASVGPPNLTNSVFYLAVHQHQCLIAPGEFTAKTFLVVPCSDPAHNLEVYAVEHGGWGHKTVSPHTAGLLARSVCLRSYRQLTGHGTPRTAGWAFFFPDSGSESTRYGDRVICSYRAWPRLAPLGSGWHVR